jgi:hypothetical protein
MVFGSQSIEETINSMAGAAELIGPARALSMGMRVRFFLTGTVGFLFLSGYPAIAQPFAIGGEGGLRTTGDVSGTLSPESKRYIVGPRVEVRLPLHLSLEFDALYRDIGFSGYVSGCCSTLRRESATTPGSFQ